MAAYSSKVIAERVAEARSRGWTWLNLYEHKVQESDLRKLLAEPGVEQLKDLSLIGNQLSTLPPEIGRLTALTRLYLHGNQLSTLPPEIGRLTVLTELYLGGNQLSTLPPEIGRLAALRELRLHENQLSTLPLEIGQLTALTTLDLRDNQLSTLPPEIGQLSALTELDLGSNQLSTLPPEIGLLTALTALRLSNNQLFTFPPEAAKLTLLMRLDLQKNHLSALPAEIGQLSAVSLLDLGENMLLSLPPQIGQLTALVRLYLSRNQLCMLPPQIGQLTALTRLDLQGNMLGMLPAEIRQLPALSVLYLHGNDLLNIPPEILGPTWEEVRDRTEKPAAASAILDYYFRICSVSDRRALNEVKVILVGQGAVGKTSLVKRIVYNTFNPGEEKTEGIYIDKSWSVPGKSKGEKVQVNFWDFGGQEIMHSTHQFFLTKRTLYLLVLDARKGENESNLQYWLKIISSYGGDSPILVVVNKCEQHRADLNETRLKKEYPGIHGFFETSCAQATGIPELKEAIEREIRAMPHVFDPLPKEYFTIKSELESLAAQQNHIAIRAYYALCQTHGIDDLREQDRLLRFLHDLGSVLSFNDPDNPYTLRETSVLNPEWVTQGVYQVINKQNAIGCNGLLMKEDLRRILDPKLYPESCYRFIIEMMQKFELCFVLEDHERWLVPELLDENEPEGLDSHKEPPLALQYHYQVLPSGIICRFIVRRYENLGRPAVCWRSGAVLHFDGCTAVVRSDKDNGRMYISVTGPEKCRRGFLASIRLELATIHATVPNLQPDERVPLPDRNEPVPPPDKPNLTVSYKHLLRLEQAHQPDIWPEGAEHSYTVAQLLDGIEDEYIRGWNRFGYLMLKPPLFVVEPETSFPDAWEVFCCGVLNRYHKTKTDNIYQRKPPDGGIDLYWPGKNIAYQCKSVEDDGGRFKLDKALESIDAALETRKDLPWDKYVLCTNVNLTGDQERKLREKLPEGELELLTPSFWQPRCIEQREHLRDRFNVLATVDEYGRLRLMQ